MNVAAATRASSKLKLKACSHIKAGCGAEAAPTEMKRLQHSTLMWYKDGDVLMGVGASPRAAF